MVKENENEVRGEIKVHSNQNAIKEKRLHVDEVVMQVDKEVHHATRAKRVIEQETNIIYLVSTQLTEVIICIISMVK